MLIDGAFPVVHAGMVPLVAPKISHLPPGGEEIVLEIVTGMGPFPGVALEMPIPPALNPELKVKEAGETETLPPAEAAFTLSVTTTVCVTLPEVNRIFPT